MTPPSPPPDPDLANALLAAQTENAALRRELDQARAELQDFTYSVSHDLRASLRHITSYAQILREDLGGSADPGARASLDAITHAALHQARLIEGLMALARIGRVALQPTPVPLEAMLADVRASLEQEMAKELANRTVQWQLSTPLPAVQGDAALVRLVLHHLLANALKFTRPQKVAQIEVSCLGPAPAPDAAPAAPASGAGPNPVYYHLCIRDNGVGFNPQYQDKLFQALNRLHSANAFEGIGMGLALCRAAVKRLGGSISATGEVDGGCTLHLVLPCAASQFM